MFYVISLIFVNTPKVCIVCFQTTPRGEGGTDDIIFSGVGSGCSSDDEDDCSYVGSGDKDVLVSPIVKVQTTLAPPTTR